MKKTKKLMALVLVLSTVLATLSMAGCGASGSTDSSADDKTFVYAMGSSWDTLFPYGGSAEDYGRTTWNLMYGTFVMLDDEDNFLDYSVDISESQMAADGKSVTFKINPDMKWSDGEPLTAEDWLFTFETITNPSLVCTMKNYFNIFAGVDESGNLESGKTISDVITVDGDTFTLYLDDVTNMDSFLYTYNNYFYVMPKHALESVDVASIGTDSYWDKPLTIGPWALESEIEGSQLNFTRNTYFPLWDDYSNITNFAIKVVGTDAMIEGIAAGEIHSVMSTLSAGDCAEAVELDGVSGEALKEPTLIVEMAINTQKITDARVRKAFDYALNREYLCTEVMGGQASPVNTFERSKYVNEDIKAEYDLKKAKELLDAAAADGAFDYSVPITAGVVTGFREQVAAVLKNDLESIGVTLDIVTGDGTTINGKMQESGAYDICFIGDGIGADPTWPQNRLFNPSVANYSQITDSKYYDLCQAINAEQDDAKRLEMVKEMQQIVYEDAPYVFVFTMESWRLYSSSLKFKDNNSSNVFSNTNVTRLWNARIE